MIRKIGRNNSKMLKILNFELIQTQISKLFSFQIDSHTQF